MRTKRTSYSERREEAGFSAAEFNRAGTRSIVKGTAFFAVLVLFTLFAARPAAATIRYRISLAHPERHLFRVEMSVPNAESGIEVALPAWNALYQIRDFAYRVRDVEVPAPSNAESRYSLRQIDKQTWQINASSGVRNGGGPNQVVVRYAIEWDDSGPFNSQLDVRHAFVNFAEILMYIPNRRAEDTEVEFDDVPAGWHDAAELPAGPSPNSFRAESYDKLADAPVEFGKFDELNFDQSGAHFRVVVDASDWNKGQLGDGLRRIVAYEIKLMDGAPFSEYTFFFHIGPYAEVGGGGMEHSNCTAIAASSVGVATMIAAHEFFHAWNVKRIRPRTLEPVDYTKEMYTRALWFAEGVTSTYGAYTLERSGLWTKDQFYGDLADQINTLESRPAHAWQSVEESSLDAWLEKYDDYNTPGRSISYYNKGQIDGVLLDLAIRNATDNKKSLDDVLRRMNEEYAKQGRFYDDSNGIRAVVEEVTGKSFEDFFRRYVAGIDEIPYSDFLSVGGLELKSAKQSGSDLGFWPTRGGKEPAVAAVETGSAAESAGLLAGDVLLRLNGAAVPRNIVAWARERTPGETIALRVRRAGNETAVSYTLGARDEITYSIAELPHPTDKQRRIRDGLLRGATD
ncbi:MAG: M61 family metallopeptidase [Candidatus Acidiferrales bacterium]